MSKAQTRRGVAAFAAFGALLMGGCQPVVSPEEGALIEAGGPYSSTAPTDSVMDGSWLEQESTTTSEDTTGRSGVYIGSGH